MTAAVTGMSDRDRAAWASARTLADLGELTARWLEGSVGFQPGYEPGWGPDDETGQLVPVLAVLNRAGYLTTCSQPATSGAWEQRAAVDGFAGPEVALAVTLAAGEAGLIVITHDPATLPSWRCRLECRVPATRIAGTGEPQAGFGAQVCRRHLRSSITGYGICHRQALDALCGAWQITVIDPEWGRDGLLWRTLAAAVTPACRLSPVRGGDRL